MNEELVFEMCLKSKSKNPIEIVQSMMDLEECRIHGPEHHLLVGSALLTAYKNAGSELELEASLKELQNRSKNVPGGACGFWGACGAGISSGMFMSIISKSGPLENKPFGLSNLMTSKSLGAIGAVGGPRCCKRDSFLSILSAVDFVRENLGVEMEKTVPACKYSEKNSQCIGERCPFHKN